MSKFLSGRQAKLNLGVPAYTENKTVLQTTGKVGIGTTDAQSYSLFVVGDVHGTARQHAHAANWYELVNKDLNGTVGTGTERYNIGPVDLTTLDVSGISTFAGLVVINSNTFKVEDLTDNRVVIAGTGGELEDDANLTFDGSKFNVGSAITYAATIAFYGRW